MSLIAIDATIRGLAELSETSEEYVVAQLAECEDPLKSLLLFLNAPELKRTMDAQRRLENPRARVMYGDAATSARIGLLTLK